MELYNNQIIKTIQNAIDTDNYKLTVYNEYANTFLTECNAIYSNGIKLHFKYYPTKNKWDYEMIIHDITIGKKYVADWKQTSIGTFLAKDWLNNKKDLLDNIPYKQIECTLSDGSILICIIRDLLEYYDDNISDNDKKELKNKFSDIVIKNHIYSLIKIWSKPSFFGPLSQESFGFYIDENIRINMDDHIQLMNSEDMDTEDSENSIVSKTLF